MTSSVTSNFPIAALTPIATINSTPSFLSIRTVQKELNTNAASVHSYEGGANHGLLALTISPQAYLAITGVPFQPPAVPPAHPNLAGLNTAAQIAHAVRQHIEDKRVFLEYKDTDKALVRMLMEATPIQYIQALEHPDLGFSGLTCLQIMTHLHEEYGQISLQDTEENQERMNTAWHPPTPIEDLFTQLDKGVIFAVAAGEPIVDRQVARIGYNIILRTGQFNDACREWRLKAPAAQTYAQFKIFFLRMNLDRQQSATAASAGFHAVNSVTTAGATTAITKATTHTDNTDASTLTEQTQQANSVALLQADLTALMTEVKDLRAQLKRQQATGSRTTALSYCWTHGYTKNKLHNSRTCTNKADGHRDEATTSNNMGGNTAECAPRKR
jgi:hypothetical protein